MKFQVPSIYSMVKQARTNYAEIQNQAVNGDATSCFQMGMIHLLGINTPIDYKKAKYYFGNPSLADSIDTTRLLGFIAECEGEFSLAFQYYSKIKHDVKDTYLDRVSKGRTGLNDFLQKLNLPTTFNKEISAILSDYSKGKASQVGACVKIAAICHDEHTCLMAAKSLFDTGDYISAIEWLKKGNIGTDHTLYVAINEMFEKSQKALIQSKEMQVIDLVGDSLLSIEDPTPFLKKIKKSCEEASIKSSNEWKKLNKKRIDAIIKKQEEQEYKVILEAQAKEEARRKIRNKIIKILLLAFFFLICMIVTLVNGDPNDKDEADKTESSLHYFGNGSKVSHHYVGTFTDAKGVFPVELSFVNEGKEISDVVYKNVQLGGQIRMHCTNFEDDYLKFEGKDGKNDFVLSLSCKNKDKLIGTARVGSKELEVNMDAKCSH